MPITVTLLSERPGALGALAAGYCVQWPDWYGPGGPGDAEADLRVRAEAEGLPLALVAMDGDVTVGTLALAERSIASHAHLRPWIVGLWVDPARRRQGVGRRLVAAALAKAAERGEARVFAATHDAAALFPPPDWRLREVVEHDGRLLTVFAADL